MSAFQALRPGRALEHEPLVSRRTAASRNMRGVARPALKYQSLVVAVFACIDGLALTILLSGAVASASWQIAGFHEPDAPVYVALGLLTAVISGASRGCYAVAGMMRWRAAARVAAWPLACAVAVVAAAMMMAGLAPGPSALIAMVTLALGASVLVAIRIMAALLIEYAIRSGLLRYKVAVFGDNCRSTAAMLANAPRPLVDVVGVYDTLDAQAHPEQLVDLLLARARRERVDAVILAYPAEAASRRRQVFDALGPSVADIFVSSDLDEPGSMTGHPLGALPLFRAQRPALTDFDLVIKGAFDRCAAVALLMLLSPLLAAVALAIGMDSPGPVLFRQPRVGYNNALFTMFKFRSMHHHAADLGARQQTTQNDARVTRVGRFIRRYSIDELPQLLNVVLGQMSLIGPRPHAPGTNVDGHLLAQVAANYRRRHRVLPGITGWAQINGSRGAVHSIGQITNRVTLDLYYIDNWSIWLDLRILVLTLVREVVSRRAH